MLSQFTLCSLPQKAVFALPAGIIGNGFESIISERVQYDDQPIVEQGGMTRNFQATSNTQRARLYNLLHQPQLTTTGTLMDHLINLLVGISAASFLLDTVELTNSFKVFLEWVELLAVIVFTIEYSLRVYSCKEDPKYSGPRGRWAYVTTFLALVDVLSVAPFWIEVFLTGRIIDTNTDSTSSNLVKALRLLRILRFERYTHAFTSFDDVFRRNFDVLTVTAFTAVLFWVFFAACLYFSERDNPDPEMAANYSTMPNSLWITLLNLSGESPLSQYSAVGKIVTSILGLFATGLFGIPIGILGAGFEQVVQEENEDNREELTERQAPTVLTEDLGSWVERAAYKFVNGIGSTIAKRFEITIYVLILVTVAVGVWQTVEGQEDAFHQVEWVAVIVFTLEYLIRFVGVGADPEFATKGNAFTARSRFLVSFYSVIDLLAIVPFYVVLALPNSFVNEYDEYLRMLRIMRLVKLDKYIPSITLIDDVIRLKFKTLRVAFYAAVTLWILFAAAMFLCEHKDSSNSIDPVPQYGCDENCTMADRFQNFFDSLIYTGIHLTGDCTLLPRSVFYCFMFLTYQFYQ